MIKQKHDERKEEGCNTGSPWQPHKNGMHSPWQQIWRGNIAETGLELVLASGCLK